MSRVSFFLTLCAFAQVASQPLPQSPDTSYSTTSTNAAAGSTSNGFETSDDNYAASTASFGIDGQNTQSAAVNNTDPDYISASGANFNVTQAGQSITTVTSPTDTTETNTTTGNSTTTTGNSTAMQTLQMYAGGLPICSIDAQTISSSLQGLISNSNLGFVFRPSENLYSLSDPNIRSIQDAYNSFVQNGPRTVPFIQIALENTDTSKTYDEFAFTALISSNLSPVGAFYADEQYSTTQGNFPAQCYGSNKIISQKTFQPHAVRDEQNLQQQPGYSVSWLPPSEDVGNVVLRGVVVTRDGEYQLLPDFVLQSQAQQANYTQANSTLPNMNMTDVESSTGHSKTNSMGTDDGFLPAEPSTAPAEAAGIIVSTTSSPMSTTALANSTEEEEGTTTTTTPRSIQPGSSDGTATNAGSVGSGNSIGNSTTVAGATGLSSACGIATSVVFATTILSATVVLF